MRKITSSLLIVFIAPVFSIAAIANDKLTNIETKDLSAESEGVKDTYNLIQEATAFFTYMSCENMLPSTPKSIFKKYEATLATPGFTLKYPQQVIVNVELKNPKSGYHKYTLEKNAVGKPWEVLSAIHLNAKKQKVTDLKLPAYNDQKAANDQLPELMKKWKDEK